MRSAGQAIFNLGINHKSKGTCFAALVMIHAAPGSYIFVILIGQAMSGEYKLANDQFGALVI